MKRLLIATALVLGGCATNAEQTRTVEVKIPVAVQPITAAQVPSVPAPLPARAPTLSGMADQLKAKVCEFVTYALKADPLLRLSAKMPPAILPKYPECEKP